MTAQRLSKPYTDVLILGSGLAGLLLALELGRLGFEVVLASKGTLVDSNTSHAQGGLAAVTGTEFLDSPELHLKDTINSGAGLVDERVASRIVNGGADLVRRLSELGVHFDRRGAGVLELALEGGHSSARVLHSRDTTGRAISLALIDQVRESPDITVLEKAFAVDLILRGDRCVGAHLLLDGGQVNLFASQVVLATGGTGQVFERTTNPPVATGDGIAMAWRAGARLIDMEFVQFHPTALYKPGAPAFLITEAARGAGAVLVDRAGQRFAHRFHPDGELATRDIVARAINTTMREQGSPCVWLDLRPIGSEAIGERFPNIVSNCRRWRIDPLVEPIPISPAAHYFMGGIWTDEAARTTVPGLYAIGECASVGLHGANRLASNSLLEAGVMAMRLAEEIANHGNRGRSTIPLKWERPARLLIPPDLSELKSCMYRHAGLERDEDGLAALLNFTSGNGLASLPVSSAVVEAANLLQVGCLIARAARERRESRGGHWRSDYPAVDDVHFRRRFYLSQNGCGWIKPARLVAARQRDAATQGHLVGLKSGQAGLHLVR